MFKKIISIIFMGLLLFLVITGCSNNQTADLVLRGGKVITLDENLPEAEAIAVKGSKIFKVGTTKEIEKYIGQRTKVIDLKDKLAVPGFIDGHGHFISLGKAMMKLNLTKAKNWKEIVAMVKDAAKNSEPDEWILGRGWHQEKWNEKPEQAVDGLPRHFSLSKVSPDNPVLLTHASGHSCIANQKAMEMADITNKTPDPAGGEIVRDSRGEVIGVFRETAQGLLSRKSTELNKNLTSEELKKRTMKAIKLAEEECLSKGVTTFNDASSSFETIDLFKSMAEEQQLRIRLWVMINESNAELKKRISDYRLIGIGNNHLTVRAVKRFMDGALGSHGAWFIKPYNDLSSSCGLNTTPISVIKETAEITIQNDFQLCIHAIGDRGNHEVLNIYEEVFKKFPHKKNIRWRIEHAQHLHPDDISRFGELGIVASMQAIHCTSDGPYVVKRLGEKRAEQGSYMWKKIINSGGVVTNGTDCPVEDVDPIANFYAAVTRKLKDGTVYYPGQRLTRKEALRSYTLDCAYAAFEDDIKGSITPGKLADITILSKDILTVPEDEILDTEVVYTIIGGKIVFKNK